MVVIEEKSLGFLLGYSHRTLHYLLSRSLEQEGWDITADQYSILGSLWKKDGISQAELVKLQKKDRASITRLLDHLERKGYVERLGDPGDARSKRVFLSMKGRESKEALVKVSKGVSEEILKGVTKEERLILSVLLEKLVDSLEK